MDQTEEGNLEIMVLMDFHILRATLGVESENIVRMTYTNKKLEALHYKWFGQL
jgi:hypothetical protein